MKGYLRGGRGRQPIKHGVWMVGMYQERSRAHGFYLYSGSLHSPIGIGWGVPAVTFSVSLRSFTILLSVMEEFLEWLILL